MIRLLLFLLFPLLLFADINQTLIKETNVTFYQNLAKELNQSAPDYALQKTLLSKIVATLSHNDKPLSPKDFAIKNGQEYVRTFYKINELLAKAKATQEQIDKIKEQLQDIKENLQEANATSNLTLQLEYAYYQKILQKNQAFIQTIYQNYPKWLDALILTLPKIEFSIKNSEPKIQSYTKSLTYLEKKIKKLSIELERWKILENQNQMQKTEQAIQDLSQKKEYYVKRLVSLRLKKFFWHLKRKSQRSLHEAKEIIDFVQKHSSDRYLPKAFTTTTTYMLDKILGGWRIKLLCLKDQLLAFLNNNSFLGIPLYHFAEALGIFLLFLVFRRIFAFIVLKSLHKMAKMTKSSIDDTLLEILSGPLKFAFIIVGLYLAFDIAQVQGVVFDKIIKSLVIFDVFWLFYNSIEVLDETIYRFARRIGKELYREIGAFFIKTLKIFIFSIGLVSILQEWDINVSAFVASLGLGGLAFALAAKDTAANLFGGLSILADRALKIDDWIKVGDVEGTVEDIGLRTTKVRTFQKSLVTVPNQMIANNPIENFSRRDIRRIKARIGLVYSTTNEQIEAIVQDIRNMLQSHPGIAKKATLLVNFDEFEDSSLSIFIYCFTNTADWAKYLAIKEDINLKIIEIVHRHGSDFAFPSESIYIEKIPK